MSRIHPRRVSFLVALGACLFLPSAVQSQIFKPKDLAPAPQRQPQNASESLEARTQMLDRIFHDYWEDKLKHSPEMASAIGDKRYDNQLSDYSVEAYDESMARGENFIERLGAIDTTGMNEQEKQRKRLLVENLINQQESAVCKPWQTPVNQFSGIQVELPMLAEMVTFTSATDYDSYVARLNKVPAAILQISTDMMLGEEAGRSEPPSVMEKVLAQVNALATAKPEDTPFATPLQRFPAAIAPGDRAQIRTAVLTAIRTQVQPAFAHFARYITAQYIPNARKQPGASTDNGACKLVAYDAASMKILQLRTAAQKALGKDFDLRAFHDEVVKSGILPLNIFEQRIEAWIQQQKAALAE